jgi:hypothetical protein
MNDNAVINFPTKSSEAEAPHNLLNIAEVTQVKDRIPQSVVLNGNNYPVTGYLSTTPGIAPGVSIGDKVLTSMEKEGVLIHGVVTPIDAPVMASFGYIEGKLVIEAQGAVILKSGTATVELSEAGEIRIDGKNVRTKAKKALTLQGGQVNLN